ncbi:50S ribosomal protein L17 [Spirochaeta lutea]|uniref:Large ribosomal subunit protein bL17 n=1 Tax=Spirochaeta lutea TaxID=1480694 RepID=A0A098QVY6_9SPIO|nr:50S ribosomal protein L17 [Spirochaeta lutea]KGE70667.1 50S ribosomal protein L17 [Spirochaeta lutea]
MKHKIGFNRLGRKASHRESMLRNMITSLIQHERITTTHTKALAVRSQIEKIITRAKVDSVHNRRMVGRRIKDDAAIRKVFEKIGPLFEKRPGGYTRILKLGKRQGDAAEMVILELVEKTTVSESKEKPKNSKTTTEKKEKKPTAKKAEKAKE